MKIISVLPDKNSPRYFEGYLKIFAIFQECLFILPFRREPLTMFCGTVFGKHWLRPWFKYLEVRHRCEIPVSYHRNCIIGVRLGLWRQRPRCLLSARRMCVCVVARVHFQLGRSAWWKQLVCFDMVMNILFFKKFCKPIYYIIAHWFANIL
jgi:hypothetical protein